MQVLIFLELFIFMKINKMKKMALDHFTLFF